MEQNKLPMRPLPVTKEDVKIKASSELTRLNYETVIKELVSTKVDPTNLVASQDKAKAAKKIEKALDELRAKEKKPHDDNAQAVQDAFMEFIRPLQAEIKRVLTDVATVNAAELAAKKKIDDENARILSVRAAITEFLNTSIRAISAARTDSEIVRIQKAIGTEKSRKNFYGNLMPELEAACETLNPQINERKEDIRKMVALQQKSEEAIKSGDIQTATEIKETAEYLEQKMGEDVLRLQDSAFEVSTGIQVSLTETTTQTVKGRRLWRWEVSDMKTLARRRPELVRSEVNAEAVEAWLSEKRKDGSLEGKDEETIDGIHFFIKPSY